MSSNLSRCRCKGGNLPLKADQASCDYQGYSYVGFENGIAVTKDNYMVLVNVLGNIIGIEHDYDKNLLFYSKEYTNKTSNSKQYRIESYGVVSGRTRLVTGKYSIREYRNHNGVCAQLKNQVTLC